MASASSGVVILDVWRWKNTFIVCRGLSCFVLDCIATKRLGKSLRHSVRFNECLLYFRHGVSYIYKFIFLAQVFIFETCSHIVQADPKFSVFFFFFCQPLYPLFLKTEPRMGWVVCRGWSLRSNLGSSAVEPILKIIALSKSLSHPFFDPSSCFPVFFSGWHFYSMLYSKL